MEDESLLAQLMQNASLGQVEQHLSQAKDAAAEKLKLLWASGAFRRQHPLDRLSDPNEMAGLAFGASANPVPAIQTLLGHAPKLTVQEVLAQTAHLPPEFVAKGAEGAYNASRPAMAMVDGPKSLLQQLLERGGRKP